MSLLKSIESIDRNAAKVFREAGLHHDWDIRALTREDLNELLPGIMNFKLRRTIYDLIHKQKPIDVIMRDVRGFIPREFVRDALTENGVLVDYLRLLKDLKGQMNEIQDFFDAHIRLLEELRRNQPGSESDPGTSASGPKDDQQQGEKGAVSDPGTSDSGPADDQQDKQVKCRTVVSGKTLDADKQLMEKAKKSLCQDGVQFVESNDDHKVNILFCPISSRIGSDIEAAMSDVKDNKPVILVLMHHERQPKFVSAGPWNSKPNNIVMLVNVYYHDTAPGLITCTENDNAISSIQKKLLEYSFLTCQNTSANGQCAGSASGGDSSTGFNGGGGNRRSDGSYFQKGLQMISRIQK